MARKNGEWTIHESIPKFQNEFMEVVEDRVTQPNGEPGAYAVVKMKPGVCILLLDDKDNVYLTKQFRYAIGRESLEVPCGGMDEPDALEAAKREAREELGIEADEWQKLSSIDIDTSMIASPVSLFVAKKLRFTKKDEDETERIETIKMPFSEAIEKVVSGVITHAPSCVMLLKAWQQLKA